MTTSQQNTKYHALLRTPALPRKYVVIYNHKHLPTLAKFRACDKVVTFLTESPPTFSALTETSFFSVKRQAADRLNKQQHHKPYRSMVNEAASDIKETASDNETVR